MNKIIYIICFGFIALTTSCTNWKQIGEDIQSTAPGDYSGMATAMNSDGSVIAVGSPYNDDNGIGAGHVRVFQNQDDQWIPLGKNIEGLRPYEHFGSTIAMSANGNIIAVGATHSNANGDNSGQVRVFEYRDNDWVQLGQHLNGANAYDEFGYYISLSDDGKILAIGAPHNEPAGEINSSITIYTLNDKNTWEILGNPIQGTVRTPYIMGHQIHHEGQIGKAFELSDDGSSLIVSSDYSQGNVIVYTWIDGRWQRKGNSINYDHRGYNLPANTVAINEGGSSIAIGYANTQVSKYANESKRGNILLNGHVQVFTLNANNEWKQVGNTIYGMDLDHFAYKVKLSQSGNRLAVTSNGSDLDGGAKDYNFVSIFELIDNKWQLDGERIKLEKAYLDFPNAVDINEDATMVIVGNSNMDKNYNTFGEVKIFKNDSE